MKTLLKLTIILLIMNACENKYPNLKDGIYADIQTDKGNILLFLEKDKTPVTVANFVSLAEGNNPMVADSFKGKKYYDGLTFHRVVGDFVIQGGDPLATGAGGPGYNFDDEITELKHDKEGILSMANGGPSTNGSQFFITHRAIPHLDGIHTVFGHVVEGLEVVDSIAPKDVMNKVEIIRVGKEAKAFDAPTVFKNYFDEKEKREEEYLAKLEKAKEISIKKFEELKPKTKTTKSGLQYLILEKGNGEAVNSTNKAMVHYAVYFENGILLETSSLEIAESLDLVNENRKNAGKYQPLFADVSPDARMIKGFKEGVGMLNVGDKAVLFLPSELAYGSNGNEAIPANSNLIFEVEVVELVKE